MIGLLGTALSPYEVYFYSSGGVEEEWSPKDVGLNRANAIVGYALGGTLSLALMISQAMESVTRAFYARSDLDLILTSPVSPRKCGSKFDR